MKNIKKKIISLIFLILFIFISSSIINMPNTHFSAATQYTSGAWHDVYGYGHCYILIYGLKSSEPEVLEYAVWGRWSNTVNGTLQDNTYCTEPRNAGAVDEPKIRYVSGPDYGVYVNGQHLYSGNTNFVDVPINESYYYSGGNNNGTILRPSIGQQKYGTTNKDLFCFSFEIRKEPGFYTAWHSANHTETFLSPLGTYAYTTNNNTENHKGSKTYFHFNYFPQGLTYLDQATESSRNDYTWWDNKSQLWKYTESLDDANGTRTISNSTTSSTVYVTVHSDQLGIKAYLSSDGGYKAENDTLNSNTRTCGALALNLICSCSAQHDDVITAYGACGGTAGYKKCHYCGNTIQNSSWDNRYGHNSVSSGNYAATCTATGWKDKTVCSNCGTVTNAGSSIPKLGHASVYGGTASVHTKCSRCGTTLTNGSSHSYTKTTQTAATCTTKGTSKYTCVCGYSYTSQDIPELGHASVYGGTASVHTKCSRCGTTLTNGSSHSYTKTIQTAATCTTKGTSKYTCVCGYSYTSQDIPELGHASPSAYSYATNNSIANGLRYKNCTRCSIRLETAYLVVLNKGTGIDKVSGGTYYTQGSTVNVKATLLSKDKKYTYNWINWTGAYTSTNQNYTFTMPANAVSLTANGNAIINQYTVTCIDKIIDNSGKTLGTSTWKADYGTTASGATKGTEKTVGKYYTGFYYDSCSTATVTENGATVYRYFKSEQININGTVNWVENGITIYRPDVVELILYQNNIELKRTTINTATTNYNFNEIDKYDKNGNLYSYNVFIVK